MPLSIITHKGKNVMYADYSSCKSQDDVFELLDESIKFLTESTDNELLILINLTDQFGSRAFMNRVKENESSYGHKVKKRALLGVEGMKKVLLMGFNKLSHSKTKSVPFSNMEDALEYLVS